MITVAGVTFSATMVALSLASSQLGPRLLVSFMRDRGNQVVLGGFIATFLFCLLSLGETRAVEGPVVSSAVTVALGMAVGSLLLLIYFIHHIASSMQADKVIATVAEDVRRCLCRIFPDSQSGDGSAAGDSESARPQSTAADAVVEATATGYLQGIDEDGLLKLAGEEDVCLHVLRRPGHFVAASDPLVDASCGSLQPDVARRIQRAFLIGGRRTAEQDPEYGINQLVEIALRALSSGINDPFTAITCVDQLAGALAEIAPRPERPPVRSDREGRVRLTLHPIDFAGVVDAALNQIRQSAATVPTVSIRLLEALFAVARHTEDPDRHRALAAHAELIYEYQVDRLRGLDRDALEQRYRAFRDVLASTGEAGERRRPLPEVPIGDPGE